MMTKAKHYTFQREKHPQNMWTQNAEEKGLKTKSHSNQPFMSFQISWQQGETNNRNKILHRCWRNCLKQKSSHSCHHSYQMPSACGKKKSRRKRSLIPSLVGNLTILLFEWIQIFKLHQGVLEKLFSWSHLALAPSCHYSSHLPTEVASYRVYYQ